MKRLSIFAVFTLIVSLTSTGTYAQNVFEHAGIGMTRSELEREVTRWTPEMREAAANDNGDLLELLNKSLVVKKIAAEAMNLTEEENPDLYWKIQFKIREELEGIMIRDHVANLDMPDMRELAEERYLVEKDRWALKPEQRLSSHILILCNSPTCDRAAAEEQAKAVWQQLNDGGDFGALAAEHSQDKASKDEGGQFKRWLSNGEQGVAGQYTRALFELEAVGDVTPVIATQFGYHIIKLDDVKEAHYLSFEEVEDKIVTALETEYRTEAARSYIRSFDLDDSAKLDGAAVEAIFSQYRTPDE